MTNQLDEVLNVTESFHYRGDTGALLNMKDGSQWFHSYKGSAPIKIRDVFIPNNLTDES